jgi:hypothetical protein
MTEGLPLRPNTKKGQVRVRIWNQALEAHRAGRIRTAEVRSSDRNRSARWRPGPPSWLAYRLRGSP